MKVKWFTKSIRLSVFCRFKFWLAKGYSYPACAGIIAGSGSLMKVAQTSE